MIENGQRQTGSSSDRSAKIDRMAHSLVEQFGDRAIEVSEHQINTGGSPSVSNSWREIMATIRHYATGS